MLARTEAKCERSDRRAKLRLNLAYSNLSKHSIETAQILGPGMIPSRIRRISTSAALHYVGQHTLSVVLKAEVVDFRGNNALEKPMASFHAFQGTFTITEAPPKPSVASAKNNDA